MLKPVVLVAVLIATETHMAAAGCWQRTNSIVVEGAVWSKDASTIAFHSGSAVFTIPFDMGPITQVVDDGSWPAWSPDGKRLAYARVVGGNAADIWTIDLESGDLQQITTWPGTDTHPDWSHDGDKIAYRSVRDDHDALYVFSFTTGMHVRLTTLEGSFPDWSPDDDRIVCERNALPEGADILIVDYPSGVEHPLFGQQNSLRYPRWHPSGDNLILISTDQRGGPGIMVFQLPSGPLLNMVCCQDDAAFSAWAPDGWNFSWTSVGNLWLCSTATAVSPATWGAVKARLLMGQP